MRVLQVVFDSNSGWKPEHQKQESGNVDTPDYFPGNEQVPTTTKTCTIGQDTQK
jgi:hypothetical protein